MNDEVASILRQLEEAFGELPIPEEDFLVEDNSGYHLDCNKIRTKFRGKHWRDVSTADINEEPEALAFFTPSAFRFFLPAFIQVSLLDPVGADLAPDRVLSSLAGPEGSEGWRERKASLLETARGGGIPEQLLSALGRFEPPEIAEIRRARVEVLTKDQRRAVSSFIAFLKKHRSEDFALDELECVEEALRS